MNLKNVFLGLAFTMLIFSCSDDSSTTAEPALDSNQAKTSIEIDDVTDEVSQIAENQIDIQNKNMASTNDAPQSMLPPCATVTVVVTGNTWTRTVDFGTVGCLMPNGNVLKGKIIIAKTVGANPMTKTYSITFDTFYINARLIQGNKTIVRSLTTTAPIQPTTTMTMNISVTFGNGTTFTKTGTRTSKMIEGFNTPIWNDNVFEITGNWSTTRPNYSQTTTVTSPLIHKMNCQFRRVQGVLTIVKNNNTAVIDFGDGTCDNQALLTINGNTSTITLGN